MFNGFEPFAVTTQTNPNIVIHGLKRDNPATRLPPLLLLHGFPQSHHIWHRVVQDPEILDKFTIFVLDLRGYGESSKPAHVSAYAKSAMARDCAVVMEQFGHVKFFVCAHDRGARVTHKLCVDYPDRVQRAILLDICPTLAMYTKTDFDFAKAYFHWFFLIQEAPLPETLISGKPREFAQLFMGGRQPDGLDIFDKSCFDYYVSVLSRPEAVQAMCQDYRASSTLDLEEAKQDLASDRRIRCPLMVLWGKNGVIEKSFDALEEWRAVMADGAVLNGYPVEDCGHYIPEQSPGKVTQAILDFFNQ
ncbi:hypothetical protein NLU13_4986 [Sarocladium strictum]|uniref:AB hydrolase-1 domain-containing protein n=1 Tax=Sarocladium strictum TaxID=5046 RepID=A0AA39L980_SARSR|nr:hypothetical protein NLU13_4986 [Sarocladium strictum]